MNITDEDKQGCALRISCGFDAGNIECVSCDDPNHIKLNIRKDHNSDFYQWFYFRLSGAAGQACNLHIENAADAAFSDGWKDYRTCASYDRKTWFRVSSSYEDGQLVIHHTPDENSVYYAYFVPYSMEMHADLIAQTQMDERVVASVIGQTLDGQDLDLLTIGEAGAGKKKMWVDGRQHPGEIMAEWWMEGFLERLLDKNDKVAQELLEKCVFYVVPNMNPDGSRRGHLRTNASGANLNREWGVATMERSPEVLLVMHEMEKTGVDFCLDVHGDETLPYNFVAGGEGVPSFTPKDQDLLDGFLEAYKKSTKEFQTKYGYGITPKGKGNLTMCTNYVAETYRCLAMTLEMPFKDNADYPDEQEGWSPTRASQLGADVLDAMLAVVDDL
jgi:murein tripeptide amidase MpaA